MYIGIKSTPASSSVLRFRRYRAEPNLYVAAHSSLKSFRVEFISGSRRLSLRRLVLPPRPPTTHHHARRVSWPRIPFRSLKHRSPSSSASSPSRTLGPPMQTNHSGSERELRNPCPPQPSPPSPGRFSPRGPPPVTRSPRSASFTEKSSDGCARRDSPVLPPRERARTHTHGPGPPRT